MILWRGLTFVVVAWLNLWGEGLVIGFRKRRRRPPQPAAPPTGKKPNETVRTSSPASPAPSSSSSSSSSSSGGGGSAPAAKAKADAPVKNVTGNVTGNATTKSEEEPNFGARVAKALRSTLGGSDEEANGESEKKKPAKPLSLKPRVLHFNLMVAGLSGLGKTTAINALFEAWTKNASGAASGERKTRPTSHVDASRVFERLDKKTNTVLRVTIVDTPGFGNSIDHGDTVRPISSFVARRRRRQYERSVRDRSEGRDSDELVHACVYFISPHRFLEIDRFFLKHLQAELPVIPVISKADTLTDAELKAYRAHLRAAFAEERIEAYTFKRPTDDPRGRLRENDTDCLAIVARDGAYPWGVSRASDPDHSDFDFLRDALLSDHTEKLVALAKTRYLVFRDKLLRATRRLKLLKTLTILAFSWNSAVTRAHLFPFVDDAVSFLWRTLRRASLAALRKLKDPKRNKQPNPFALPPYPTTRVADSATPKLSLNLFGHKERW
mmetsp:Transcript_888/g.2610  ORF Transcript_888/g.2610 Transcript_888/m.2610 type:complete len:496 (-) Transcript_888:413-1900(-)